MHLTTTNPVRYAKLLRPHSSTQKFALLFFDMTVRMHRGRTFFSSSPRYPPGVDHLEEDCHCDRNTTFLTSSTSLPEKSLQNQNFSGTKRRQPPANQNFSGTKRLRNKTSNKTSTNPHKSSGVGSASRSSPSTDSAPALPPADDPLSAGDEGTTIDNLFSNVRRSCFCFLGSPTLHTDGLGGSWLPSCVVPHGVQSEIRKSGCAKTSSASSKDNCAIALATRSHRGRSPACACLCACFTTTLARM